MPAKEASKRHPRTQPTSCWAALGEQCPLGVVASAARQIIGGTRAICRGCPRAAPTSVQNKQRAAVAAAAKRGPPATAKATEAAKSGGAAGGAPGKSAPWKGGERKDAPEATKWKQECQKLRAQLAQAQAVATTPTSEGTDGTGAGDSGGDAEHDAYADEITELQKLVDSMASTKSATATEHRAQLQERLSQLRDKQRAQWPLERRILLADRRKTDKERAKQKADKALEEAKTAHEADKKALEEAQRKADEAQAVWDKATHEREQLGEVKAEDTVKPKDDHAGGQAAADAWEEANLFVQEEFGLDEETKAAWSLVQSKVATRREEQQRAAAAAATAEQEQKDAAAAAAQGRETAMDVDAESDKVLRAKLAQRGIHLSAEQERQLEETDSKRQRKA